MHSPLPALRLFVLIFVSAVLFAGAEEFDARASLGVTAGRSVDAAVKRAAKENKRVLVLAVDPEKKTQSFHIKGMFEFEESKELLKEHFLLVVTDFKEKHVRDWVGAESQERPVYFLLNRDGSLLQKGTTAVGGAAGNKLVKDWVARR